MTYHESDGPPKVVGLRGQAVLNAAADPHPRVVAALEDMLEKARSGEIQGIMGAYLYRDGSTGSAIVGAMSYSLAGRVQAIVNNAFRDLEDAP